MRGKSLESEIWVRERRKCSEPGEIEFFFFSRLDEIKPDYVFIFIIGSIMIKHYNGYWKQQAGSLTSDKVINVLQMLVNVKFHNGLINGLRDNWE